MLRQYITKATKTLQRILEKFQPPSLVMSARDGKRKWETDDEDNVKKAKSGASDTDKVRLGNKKKVAMLMVFSGKGYYGMQRTGQEGCVTIEDELAKALLLAEAIPQDHHDTLQKMSFQRAARTDKGVSAAGQVVSLKMRVDMDDLVKKVNSFLKPQIRVLGYRRTTKTFNCKNWCDSRTYSYMMPTFAFAPLEQNVVEAFRVSCEIVNKVNSLLSLYKGTHNFHNFTSGKKADDASAKRYIIEMTCGEPFERDNLEWVVIQVKGQSFMLHQIRKMIGMVIAIVRGMACEESIKKAFAEPKFDVPKAPGLGLMLEKLHYDKYNKKFGSDGVHEPIDWTEYEDEIIAFKEKYIYPTIIETEKNEKSMIEWLATLHYHTFDEKELDSNNMSDMAIAARKVLYSKKQNEEVEQKEEICVEQKDTSVTSTDILVEPLQNVCKSGEKVSS